MSFWEQLWEEQQKHAESAKRHYWEECRDKLLNDPIYGELFVVIIGTEIKGPYRNRDLAMSEANRMSRGESIFVTQVGNEDEEERMQKALLQILLHI